MDDWDDTPGWRWRARRLLISYDVSAFLPDTPSGFARMPDGVLMGLTAWPADFTVADWHELTESMKRLALELTGER